MTNPYLITGPALISFSGGRTSGYMLWHIIHAHGGTLPDNVHVTFANTGREAPETLDFVQECADRWNVRIVWLELDYAEPHHTRIVSHNSASRDGEPFAALIAKRGFLPNPVTRFCTTEMKIRRMKAYMLNTCGYEQWTNVIGLRADEMHRVEKRLAANASTKERWTNACPLAAADVTKREVKAFWDAQPFDLRLENINGNTPDGNCDLCMLKGEVTIKSIMRRKPETATWWIGQEAIERPGKPDGSRFRNDRPSYAAMRDSVQRQGDLIDFLEDGGSIDCFCHD